MTIGELQTRMTRAELSTWIAYIEENGPQSLALRMESAIARAVSPFLKNVKPSDLMLWPKQPERIATAEDIHLMLMNMASRKKH